MIRNEQQKSVTAAQIATLTEALDAAAQDKSDMDPRLYEAMVAGIRSQIDDLEQEIEDYEAAKTATALSMDSWQDIPRLLIQGRIARGLTQKDLAEKLDLKPQQIQKYEATDYAGASLRRVLEVFAALELDIEADVPLRDAAVPTEK